MKKLLYLLIFLPFMVKSQSKDTIKVVMLVSDTSSVQNKPNYQDTRPFTMYGYQVKGGFLDMYKQRLNKNIIIWIAYKVK